MTSKVSTKIDNADNKEKNFLVQGSILAVAGLISRFIGMIYRIPMTNALGEVGLSYYENAFMIYNLALIISSYGLPLAVSRMVAAKTAKNEYKNAYKLFKASLGFAIVSGGAMALIIYFFSEILSKALFDTVNCALPLKVLAPTIFLCAVMGVFRGYFQGNSTMIPTAVSQLVEQIINAIISIWATYTFIRLSATGSFMSINTSKESWGAAGGTLGTCIGALSGLVVLLIIFVANMKIIRRRVSKDSVTETDSYIDIYKVMFLTIMPVILGQTLYNLNSIVDRTFFSHMFGGSENLRGTLLGRYGKYYLLISVPIAVATALGNSIIPAIVREHVNNNETALKSKINLAIKFNMMIAIPSAVGLAALGKYVIESLFAGTSPMVAGFMSYGAIAVVFYSLSTISNAVLQGIGLMRYPLIHSSIAFVGHLIVVVGMLSTGFGIHSVVVGNAAFGLFVCILNWRKIGKVVDYKQEIKYTFLVPTVCSVIMGGVIWVFANVFSKNVYIGSSLTTTRITTCLSLIIAMIVYFITMLLFKGFTEEELKRLPMGRKLVRFCKKLHLI